MGTAKVPLRELATLFTHLGPNTKAQVMSAFAEAEDNLNFNNSSNINSQQKRKLSGLVASPILTSTLNSRGFDVSWARLDDKRISTYEVQVSFNSVFSNPDVYQIVDTSLALEGIGTTVYVRARGVRFDGQCGPWSDPIQVDAFATTAGPVVYSRGYDDIPSFYKTAGLLMNNLEVQHISITPQRQNGGIVTFGSIGLKDAAPFIAGDKILVRLNSQVLDNIPLDVTPYTESLTQDINVTQNFSIGFGPAFLTHTNFNFSTADQLHPASEAQSGSGSGTFSGWNFFGTGAVGSPQTTFFLTNYASYTQYCTALGDTKKTKYLHLTNLGAAVPSGNTITGFLVTMYGDISPHNYDYTKSKTKVIEFGLIDDTSTRRTSITTGVVWPDSISPVSGDSVPSVSFGGASNLFGETSGFWTPTKVNSANFGIYLRGQFGLAANDTTAATWLGVGTNPSVDMNTSGITVTIYSINANLEARVDVVVTAAGGATLTNCAINAIEFGQAIGS